MDEHPDQNCEACVDCPACSDWDVDPVRHIWSQPGVVFGHCGTCHGLEVICSRWPSTMDCGATVGGPA